MKAVTGTLPADEAGWAFEIKWDGVRVLSSIQQKGVRLRSSRGNDITGRYPELRGLADALDGQEVMPLPYTERRRLLAELVPDDGCWTVPAYRDAGDGLALLDAVRQQGLEGVMAKRVDSPYLAGKRSSSWVKAKARLRQEFVVGGWQPGEKGRLGQLGSLLVGVYDKGTLRYCGKVGTGFTMRELARLDTLLEPLTVDASPFDPP